MHTIHYPSQDFERLCHSSQEIPERIRRNVENILRQVQRKGNTALTALTRRLDGVSLKSKELRVKNSRLRTAQVSLEFERAARLALKEIQRFATASLPKNWSQINGHGGKVGEKFDPLRRIGVYIPGGSAPLVSTIFMTVALARVAGVKEVIVCTPPPIAEALLWALSLCEVTEVYQIGGAQAMAAMAYGTPTIRPVDKLFGPGNVYVTEAKRQLFGTVGIDLLAGPSELMILADESTRVEWAAADLLAQAEHGSGRERIFCVSSSQKVLKEMSLTLRHQGSAQDGNRGLQMVLKDGTWLIHTHNQHQLIEVANALAPEHLQIMTRFPRKLVGQLHTAGAVFLGNYTPTVVGDFVAGPSHTLPTGRAGRAFSGLRVTDFMRRTSVVEYSPRVLRRIGSVIETFARVEKLPYHSHSLKLRTRC